MPIGPPQLAAQLARGLKPLYALVGDEPLQQQEAADAIRAAARAQGYTERRVFQVAGHFDWGAVLADAGAMSLFAERRLIEIRIPSGKPGKDGSQALQRLAEQAADNPDTLVLVMLARPDAAGAKSAWFAALESQGVLVRTDPIERAQLPAWIAQRLQAQGQRVAAGEAGQRTLAFIADRVEGNLLAAHQEIQKLALLYPAGELAFEPVEQAVLDVARYDPFKLAEAVLDGQPRRVQRLIDGLQAEGVAPVLVHWALAEDIRALHRVRQAMQGGTPLPMALREQRVWGPRERRFERLLPRLKPTQIARWLQDAHTVDGICKGLKPARWPADPWQALLRLAMAVCRAAAPEPAAARAR